MPVQDPLSLLHEVADAVAALLAATTDWGPSGLRSGQYSVDLRADAVALAVLQGAGVGVLSEESGSEHLERSQVVVVDPLDGSTNASRGVPWFATALCLVDGDGMAASLVVNQSSGVRYWAKRGEGAWSDGVRLAGTDCEEASQAIVALNGVPVAPLGTAQSRMFGAAALDLCLVAAGVLDGYVDCAYEAHGVWDYLASALICHEAGITIGDAFDRDLLILDHTARRTPVAAATPALHEALSNRRRAGGPRL